jgi:hypothetical protein
MNHRGGKDVPHFDVQLLFDEIGIVVDRNQYRDVVSLLDMFHFYARQHQVCQALRDRMNYAKLLPVPNDSAIQRRRAGEPRTCTDYVCGPRDSARYTRA